MMWFIYGLGIFIILLIAKRVFENWLYDYKRKGKTEVSFAELGERLLIQKKLHVYVESISIHRDVLEPDKNIIEINGFIELCEKCIPQFANVKINVFNYDTERYQFGLICYENDRDRYVFCVDDIPYFSIEIHNKSAYEEILHLAEIPNISYQKKVLDTDISRTLMTMKSKRTVDIFYKKDENGDKNREEIHKMLQMDEKPPREMYFLITNIGINQRMD